jgi:Flp pilus assembly protein TadG
VALLAFVQPFRTGAQTFPGTNQPGAGSSFQFTVAAGATNLSLVVTNSATAFSYLYLKRGGVASLSNCDFVARLNQLNNSLNLEPPELVAGASYGLWVYTPTNSVADAFAVSLSTNRADARLASLPILKPLAFLATGTVAAGGVQYFQVDVPTNLPGWRLVLTSSGTADADLYIQRGALPSQTSYLKRSTDRAMDTVFLDSPEATSGTYFISVLVPGTDVGSATYTLGAEIAPVVALNWEPGTTLPRPDRLH